MLFQAPAQAAAKPIRIIIDGVTLSTDRPPVMVNGRTLVPLRAIFEAFNADIKWNQKTQTVTASQNDTTIELKIGSKIATINNKTVSLDVPGQNLKGRTMVPTRFVSEALGREVGWNPAAQIVTITTPVPVGEMQLRYQE
ncbi:copper amine oxidase N-terminal domain-containing protein [Paenibacillus rhizoplanae]